MAWRRLRRGDETTTFEAHGDGLYIDGKRVERGWESLNGWYWFGLERAHRQDSVIGATVYEDDQIWFGYVQGDDDEYGYFSQAEVERLAERGLAWPIPKKNLPHSGRRG